MLSKNDQLSALSWKCEQLGISYGRLVNQSTPHELHEIYNEYEELLKKRQKERAAVVSSFHRTQSLTKSEYKSWNETIISLRK